MRKPCQNALQNNNKNNNKNNNNNNKDNNKDNINNNNKTNNNNDSNNNNNNLFSMYLVTEVMEEPKDGWTELREKNRNSSHFPTMIADFIGFQSLS